MQKTGEAVSEIKKLLARHTAKAFGGTPHARAHQHDTLPLRVDIVYCQDRPEPGQTAYGTIGLSEIPLKLEGKVFPTRVELAGICNSSDKFFPNVLAAAAFHFIRSQDLCFPGLSLRDYVKEYFPDTTVPHLYFTAPFLWKELSSQKFPDRTVAWLLAVPISDAELEILAREGDDELEERLDKAGVDIADLHRPSLTSRTRKRGRGQQA